MGKRARLVLCTAALLASTGWVTGAAQTSGAIQGQRVAEAKCATCHGTDGNSPDPQFPKLAGQNVAYLYSQLWAFKRGARRSEVMSGIVATLSDADMAHAANFYSRQLRKPDTVKDRRLAAMGERIFFAGMPPCAMCHGSAGQRGLAAPAHSTAYL
jgi:cytochrome c553